MTLGRTIRDAREAASVSLESLSDATSLRMGLLSEMESNNFKHCGGDIYARGHLRNIAAIIGLNPQILIDLYNEEHAIESQRIHDSLVDNNVIQVPREKKSLSWKVPAVTSVAILLIIAVVQIVMSNQSPSPVATPSVSATASASASATPSTTPSATPTASAVAAPSATTTHGPVSLVISASRGNSYIDIFVDGKEVEKGSIFQGESKTYKGSAVISVYFSNPAGLDVTFNGKLLAPLGGQNEEVRRTFR
jgi:cytoskeletal protein RodZ